MDFEAVREYVQNNLVIKAGFVRTSRESGSRLYNYRATLEWEGHIIEDNFPESMTLSNIISCFILRLNQVVQKAKEEREEERRKREEVRNNAEKIREQFWKGFNFDAWAAQKIKEAERFLSLNPNFAAKFPFEIDGKKYILERIFDNSMGVLIKIFYDVPGSIAIVEPDLQRAFSHLKEWVIR